MQHTPSYKVIFSGNTVNGKTTQEVADQFSKAFNLNDKQMLMRLFSGKMITLKRGLAYEQAQRYSNILLKLGADCCIEREHTLQFANDDVDIDYERKKRRRVAQFSSDDLSGVSIAPKT